MVFTRSRFDTQTCILSTFSREKTMVSDADIENLTKASQGAALLVEDLEALTRSSNPLLAELSVNMLKTAVELEQKLKRIALLSQDA